MKPIRRDILRPDAVAETPGIGLYGETSLHDALKRRYATSEDRIEATVEGFIVDIVTSDGEFIEVQTAGLRKLKTKCRTLARVGRVRIVHPIVVEKILVRTDPTTGAVLSRRRSPKRGTVWSAFDELVTASWIVGARNVRLELVFVRIVETRCRDGSGSWRRRGDRIMDRGLVEVLETRVFSGTRAWRALIPPNLGTCITTTDLATAVGIPTDTARKALYVLAKAGIVRETGKRGRAKLYTVSAAKQIRNVHSH